MLDGTSDMVVGARLISLIWGARLTDVLSGYRAFTAEVARILPVVSSGFEVETEMTARIGRSPRSAAWAWCALASRC